MGNSGDDFGTIPTPMLWFFGAVVTLMVCMVVLAGVTAVRNRRVLRQAGIDPGTVDSQLLVRYLRGQTAPMGRPAVRSAPDRLAELADLRDRGLITSDEYQARRTQILDGI
jgi:hypothetical protein